MEIRIGITLILTVAASALAAWQNDPDCGLQYIEMSAKIVGGEKADEFEWPWQAALYRGGRRICGASLIHEDWIITAAHCVDVIFEPEIFEFRVGSKSLTNSTEATQTRQASEVYVHPMFDPSTLDYDIALFKMSKDFDIWGNHKVNTVCLPTKDMEEEFEVGSDSVVTGWGTTEEGGTIPDELYEVTVPIYDQDLCNESYTGEITDNMICAGLPEGGVDSCQGDSGGPMVAKQTNTSDDYYLIGIVSWGTGCAREGFPGVYTRVTQFEEWISPIFDDDAETNPVRKDGICDADQFLCRGGECINDIYRCSGSSQCYHGTDEEFCDGLLKMFDVFYYEQINPDNVTLTRSNRASKEECANICLDVLCEAFDVTADEGGTFTCDFAVGAYSTEAITNEDRTFNHFQLHSQSLGNGDVYSQAAGVIASPFYYSQPEIASAKYTWFVNVPFSSKDTLLFKILAVNGSSTCEDLETDFALLSIKGGGETGQTSYCLNADAEGAEFKLPDTEAVVEMITSDASQYGFLLEYQSYYDCDKEYDIGPGVVTSPNYPSNYPNSVRCTTHLQAPTGEVVYFTFDVMDIEPHSTCSYDWVGLYDGPNDDAPVLGYYCGSKVPKAEFQSNGTDMFIKFSSDGSVTGGGFKANFDFGVATVPTQDPNIALLNSLESELSAYKFGMAAACILGFLLIIVLSASLYTVNKRDAYNIEKVARLKAAEKGKAGKSGYSKMDDGNIEERYARVGEEIDVTTTDSHGTQATKAAIVSETGHNSDYENMRVDEVDGGVVNKGFANDEGMVVDEAAVLAAVNAAVVEMGEEPEIEGDNNHYNTTVVVADVSPQPQNTEYFTPPPPEAATAPHYDDAVQLPTATVAPPMPSNEDNHMAQYVAGAITEQN